ncbi:TetR/AcrR family transcriptional regulator [Paenibacillus sp. FA6]|uniref:TetR/AcrR family transcriptional regulator n=1 Tax=Paenibacillus sp. FA6 TaxID=3413029 RepID=UPI003F6588F1
MDQDVKVRILLAAKQLFAEQGFDGTTVRQICEKANANISLISYHFGGKEKVLQNIFEMFFPGAEMNTMEEMDELLHDPVIAIQFIVDQIISFSYEDKQLSSIINQELTMGSPRSEVVRSYIQPIWSKVDEILMKGKMEGVFHFDSLDHTSLVIKGICLSYKNYHKLMSGAAAENIKDYNLMKQTAIQFVLKGLQVK